MSKIIEDIALANADYDYSPDAEPLGKLIDSNISWQNLVAKFSTAVSTGNYSPDEALYDLGYILDARRRRGI